MDNHMDKDEFSKNVLSCEETLYRISKSILYCDSDCEDAVSEAVLTAYSKLSSLKNEKYFSTWLVRILINECFRINRTEHKTVDFEEYMKDEKSKDRDYSELYEALYKLPAKIRVTVTLHYIEGYSVEETGDILKIPTGTVKSRLSSGRKQLKDLLEQ